MFHRWRMRRKGRLIAYQGAGPFTSAFAKGFIHAVCQQCGARLPETALLGNALTVQPNEVAILCSYCRCGIKQSLYDKHPFEADGPDSPANNTVDRLAVLGEIATLTGGSNHSLSYYECLLCLRNGLGCLQRLSRHPFSGFTANRCNEAKHQYGNSLPGSCGECGALWANEWEMRRDNIEDILRSRGYETDYCYACAFPHEQQWFLRSSPEWEMRLLENDQE